MTLPVKTTVLLATPILILLLAPPAQGRDDLSGTWRENFNEIIYSVEQWSPACGKAPKTTGRKKRKLKFKVEDRGIDLVFVGKSTKFSSVDCQTRNKAVRPKERTVKDRLFMISCSTKEDASNYENGLYSFRIKGSKKIDYRETTRFSRNAAGSMCVHTMRIRRSYTKLSAAPKVAQPTPAPEPDPDPAPAPEPTPAPAPAPEPAPADPCAKPGAVVSVSIEPSRAEVRAGGKVCLEVMATDAKACEVKARPRWASGRAPKHIKLTSKGCLKVSRRAKKGTRTLKLKAGGIQTEVELVVRSRTARIARPTPEPEPAPEPTPAPTPELAPQPLPEPEPIPDPEPVPVEPEPTEAVDAGALEPAADGEPTEEPAPAPDAGPEPAADSAAAPASEAPPPPSTAAADSEPMPWWIWAAAGGGVLLLAIIILVIALGRRKQGAGGVDVLSEDAEDESAAPRPKTVEEMAASFGLDDELDEEVTGEPASPTEQASGVLCPQCSSSLPDGSEFCTNCGNHLTAPPEPEPQASPEGEPVPSEVSEGEPEPGMAFCINCGESIPAAAKFCPFCATKQS